MDLLALMLTVLVEGPCASGASQSMLLAGGDAFTFPGREPHTWANDDPRRPCRVLWVLAPAP
jgi:hypothetical protein